MSIVNKKFWKGFTDNQERNYITSKIPSKCTPIGIELNVILYTLEFGCQTITQQSKPTIKAKSKSKHTSACIVTSAFNSPIYKNKFSLTSKGFNRVKGKTWHFFQFTRETTCRKNTHSPKIRLDTGFLCTNKQLLWNEPLCSNFRAPKIKKSNQSP